MHRTRITAVVAALLVALTGALALAQGPASAKSKPQVLLAAPKAPSTCVYSGARLTSIKVKPVRVHMQKKYAGWPGQYVIETVKVEGRFGSAWRTVSSPSRRDIMELPHRAVRRWHPTLTVPLTVPLSSTAAAFRAVVTVTYVKPTSTYRGVRRSITIGRYDAGSSCSATRGGSTTSKPTPSPTTPSSSPTPVTATWTAEPPTNPDSSSAGQLSAVSCPSPSWCLAIGDSALDNSSDGPETGQAFAELWNGTSWSMTSLPISSSYVDWMLSCPSATYCMATDGQSVFALKQGTWSSVTSPVISTGGMITGLSCAAQTLCAIGYYDGNGGNRGTAIWDGSTWTEHTFANVSVQDIDAVSCPTTGWCMAVGTDYDSSSQTYQPLAVTYTTAGGWVTDPSPAVSGSLNYLSCASTTSCLADGTGSAALAYSWNGQSWSAVANPAYGPVSCTPSTSSTSCVVIGNGNDSLLWSGGSSLATDPASATGLAGAYRQGVSCPTAGTCLAVGAATGTDYSSPWAALRKP